MAMMMITICEVSPTAVNTESMAKIISMSRIIAMTLANEARSRPAAWCSSVSSVVLKISRTALYTRNKPPPMSTKSARLKPWPLFQSQEKGDAKDQGHPPEEGQPQPQPLRTGALLLGQPFGDDGDEDDVVDAEDDLQHHQGEKGHQALDGQ